LADERRGGLGEGVRTGIGILTAFKEAVEETLQEAIERGDLSQDRAKATMKDAVQRLQGSLEDARVRFDVVSRREFEELRSEVVELRARLDRIQGTQAAIEAPTSPDAAIPVD
jgi:polyhydroxyalkanoate synthesis regulator phasin